MPEDAGLTPEEFMAAIRAGDLVAAMRAGYEAFNERGFDMSVFHPEAEWHQRPQLPDARTHRGRDEIARMNDEFIGSFEDFRAEPLEILETGGKVVAVVTVSGRVKGSDQRVVMEEVHVWSFRDGMACEVQEYLTKDEALKAVGSEADAVSANVDLVRSLLPTPDTDLAQNFRDDLRWAAVSAALAPSLGEEFQCIATGYLEAEHETFVGLDGLRYLWLEWLSPWESYRSEIEETIDLGEDVVVLVRDFGRRAGEVGEVPITSAAIWTVRDAKISQIAFWADRATALKAVGLEA